MDVHHIEIGAERGPDDALRDALRIAQSMALRSSKRLTVALWSPGRRFLSGSPKRVLGAARVERLKRGARLELGARVTMRLVTPREGRVSRGCVVIAVGAGKAHRAKLQAYRAPAALVLVG